MNFFQWWWQQQSFNMPKVEPVLPPKDETVLISGHKYIKKWDMYVCLETLEEPTIFFDTVEARDAKLASLNEKYGVIDSKNKEGFYPIEFLPYYGISKGEKPVEKEWTYKDGIPESYIHYNKDGVLTVGPEVTMIYESLLAN